jgi:hypothetical protein
MLVSPRTAKGVCVKFLLDKFALEKFLSKLLHLSLANRHPVIACLSVETF